MGIESKQFLASARATSFVRDSLSIDAHIYADAIGWPKEKLFREYMAHAIDVGIDGVGMSVANHEHDFEQCLKVQQRFLSEIFAHDQNVLARTADDFTTAADENKTAVFFSAQGSSSLNDDPDFYMPLLKNMGVGTMSLVYNTAHVAGSGCMVDEPGEVTNYGKQVIDAIHKNRVVLDLSHASKPTALSAMAYSQKNYPDRPFIYSHSAPRGVYDNHRNASDAEIKACAASGGVVALNTNPWFIIDGAATETTPAHIVTAISYVKDLVGIDHIGLASDDLFSWKPLWEALLAAQVPNHEGVAESRAGEQGRLTMALAEQKPGGTAEPSKIYPALVDAMWEAGFSDTEIQKVLGLNLMRVFKQVWG